MTILILTLTYDPHADIVVQGMKQRHGTDVFRFNYNDFPAQGSIKLAFTQNGMAGSLTQYGHTVDLHDIQVVWNRRRDALRFGPMDSQYLPMARTETTAAIEGMFHCLESSAHWVNPLDKQRVANRKLLQLQVAAAVGLTIPHTLVTNEPDAAIAFVGERPEEFCTKAVELAVVGDKGVYTQKLSAQHTQPPLSDAIGLFPTLFQKYIPKSIEIRATIMGNHVYAAEIDNQSNPGRAVDWRHYDRGEAKMRPHELPRSVEQKCLAVLERLGLVFGCFDLILTPDGDYVFLEVNPMGQFGFLQTEAGLPVFDGFIDFLVALHDTKKRPSMPEVRLN